MNDDREQLRRLGEMMRGVDRDARLWREAELERCRIWAAWALEDPTPERIARATSAIQNGIRVP